ncbi:hypothetical protein [Halorussus halobius]|uniref:hypothetical protein n=1 Tax=Halorussus halobius TaxID=1710537 RepID=UPI0010932014|nr:hypothetical protein [Halorussus halobius]
MTDAQSGTDAGAPADDAGAPTGGAGAPSSDPEDSATDARASQSLVVGSFRRAVGETDSYLLKSYAVVGAFLAVLLALLLVLALPVWIFNTAGQSELATFSRAFLVVGGVLLLVGLAAPVVGADRRRAGGTASRRTDALLAASGYLFVGSLYLALLVSAPSGQRGTPPALIAPVVEFLYALPAVYAVAPPILAGALIPVVYRLAR